MILPRKAHPDPLRKQRLEAKTNGSFTSVTDASIAKKYRLCYNHNRKAGLLDEKNKKLPYQKEVKLCQNSTSEKQSNSFVVRRI